MIHFFSKVLSRGRVVLSKIHKEPGAITVVRFKTTAEMCPSMRIVVYYTLESNGKTEVVSDFTVVDVKDEFKNKVFCNWRIYYLHKVYVLITKRLNRGFLWRFLLGKF